MPSVAVLLVLRWVARVPSRGVPIKSIVAVYGLAVGAGTLAVHVPTTAIAVATLRIAGVVLLVVLVGVLLACMQVYVRRVRHPTSRLDPPG